jgi:hypothetical protein
MPLMPLIVHAISIPWLPVSLLIIDPWIHYLLLRCSLAVLRWTQWLYCDSESLNLLHVLVDLRGLEEGAFIWDHRS